MNIILTIIIYNKTTITYNKIRFENHVDVISDCVIFVIGNNLQM